MMGHRNLRRIFERHINLRLRIFETRTGVHLLGLGRRHWIKCLPAQEIALRGVFFEHVDRQRRPGARQAEHEHRLHHRVVGQFGILLQPILNAKAVGEVARNTEGERPNAYVTRNLTRAVVEFEKRADIRKVLQTKVSVPVLIPD